MPVPDIRPVSFFSMPALEPLNALDRKAEPVLFSFTGFSARNGMLPKQMMAKNAANNFALIPIGRSGSL